MLRRLRSASYATRLFVALFLLSALPSLVLLGAGAWAWTRYVALTGTLGPWGRVAETGRALLDEVEAAAPPESPLARAAAAHREELSRSVAFARRFEWLGGRLARMLPWLALGVWLLFVGACAFWVARGLSAQLSRPIAELVGWSERIAREAPLPPPRAEEAREAPEFRRLRAAFRAMARDLAEGRARALEAERLRAWTEMARRVAHELKNPLTPIRLAVARLERGLEAAGVPADAWRTPVRVIAEESERLEETARAFAQLGRMPEGPVSEIDLGALLRALADRHAAERARVTLRVAPDVPLVRGQYEALERAFRNLLVNALDAVEGRPDAEVEMVVEREDSTVCVRVRDTGPGIDPALADRIWDPDVTTKSRGTGLGLTLVRQTVRAHGGAVEARNRPEGGAEFVVRLPAAPPGGLDAAGPGLEV
jgi:two-component system nitrogen regulation sensor histidine kinase NtrY